MIVQDGAKTDQEAPRAIIGASDMPQETFSIAAKKKTTSGERSLGEGILSLLPDRNPQRAPLEVAKLVTELKGFIFPD